MINNCVAIGLLASWEVNNRKPGEQACKAFDKECIVFALRNPANQITGLYFRSTTHNDNQKHYYIKESTGLYPTYPKQETQKLIIAESVIDAASLLQIEAITKQYSLLAAYGTTGSTTLLCREPVNDDDQVWYETEKQRRAEPVKYPGLDDSPIELR